VTYRGPGRFGLISSASASSTSSPPISASTASSFGGAISFTQGAMPTTIATITPFESKDEFDSGDYYAHARPLPRRDRLAGEDLAERQADRRALPWRRDRMLHRGAPPRDQKRARALCLSPTECSRYMSAPPPLARGSRTAFAQIAADALEIPIERVRGVFHGSTSYVSDGYGAYHSRSIS